MMEKLVSVCFEWFHVSVLVAINWSTFMVEIFLFDDDSDNRHTKIVLTVHLLSLFIAR